MSSRRFWRDIRKRWRQLDKKGLGIGGIALLLLHEGIKNLVGAFFPGGLARGVGFLVAGGLVTLYYLLREVDLGDAKEAAEEVAEGAKEKVDEATDDE